MKKYVIRLVFFVEDSNIDQKKTLLNKLRNLKEVTILDIYDDDEDWNVECEVNIENGSTKNIDDAIHYQLIKLLPNVTWDYHYIKGVDNNFYWQP